MYRVSKQQRNKHLLVGNIYVHCLVGEIYTAWWEKYTLPTGEIYTAGGRIFVGINIHYQREKYTLPAGEIHNASRRSTHCQRKNYTLPAREIYVHYRQEKYRLPAGKLWQL